MDFDYRLPGTDEPAITVRRTALGRIAVLVNGVPARRRGGVYEVPGPDGEAHLLRVTGAWTGLRAVADGWSVELEPPVPLWARLLIVLPLALVMGGLVGGLIGVIGATVNAVVGRLPLVTAARVAVMLGVLAVSAMAWLGVAAALTTMPATTAIYTTGTCLNGITATADLVAHKPTVADCSGTHDAEVVGTFTLDAAAAFPGEAALSQAAVAQCPALFEAYVGIAFNASRLDIVPVVPTAASWSTGDREIACVAIATDGSKLTGSVKGTAK